MRKIERFSAFEYFIRSLFGILAIVAASLLVLIAAVFLLSQEPVKAITSFFTGPFNSLYALGNMLDHAVPLAIGAVGVSLAMRSGNMNIGGEGQVYAGAIVTTIIAVALPGWGLAGALIAVLASMAITGAVAGLSGYLRARWNASDLITTFLLSNIIILIVDYLVAYPFVDPETNLISTRFIDESYFFSYILSPSQLNSSMFIALGGVVLAHLFLYRSRRGFELRMFGDNEEFARYAGVGGTYYRIMPMSLSGALYGLAGSLSILGTYHATIKGFSAGLGWNALLVALIARFKPAAIIPAALFFAFIDAGARSAMFYSDVTYEISYVVQAVIFFLISSTVLQRLALGRRRV